MDEECLHGILAMTCTLCRSRATRAAVRAGHLPPDIVVAEAGFDSRCPGCDGHISAGERIYKHVDDSAFECETCLVDQLRKSR